MREKILKKLHEIEHQHDIQIFYAAESGSRAWGFASKDSDYDIRFLYYHRPQWYFSISKQKDSLEEMSQNRVLDFAGWELKKTLGLLAKGNVSLYEWLHSSLVYIQSPLYQRLAQLQQTFYNPKALLFSYIAFASRNYRTLGAKIKVKKYLYILRMLAACRWIERRQTPPPIEIERLKEVLTDTPATASLNKWIENKKQGSESLTITAPVPINQWIEQQLAYYKAYADQLPQIEIKMEILSRFLSQTVLKR